MTHNQKLNFIGQVHEHSHEPIEEEDLFPSTEPALIFDAYSLDENVPAGFNAVRIALDAGLKSDLIWEKEQLAAEKYIKQGLKIFWDIDFGLTNLPLPLGNQSQFLSLTLALKHFRDTLWKKFRQETVGICLYRGSADFSLNYLWIDEELKNLREWIKDIFSDISIFVSETMCQVGSFEEIDVQTLSLTLEGRRLKALYCRDVFGKYLELLLEALPDNQQCYILLDIESIFDPLLQIQLTTKERFSGINLGIRGQLYNDDILAWEGPCKQLGLIGRELKNISIKDEVRVGVCLPSTQQYLPSKWKGIKKALNELKEEGTLYRAIPEVSLTTEWDGLDTLIVSAENLSVQGRRKLLGFQAAGGIVVYIV